MLEDIAEIEINSEPKLRKDSFKRHGRLMRARSSSVPAKGAANQYGLFVATECTIPMKNVRTEESVFEDSDDESEEEGHRKVLQKMVTRKVESLLGRFHRKSSA
jgi:hypothetical protein